MVHREGGIMRLYKALRRNGRVAILIDLTLPPSMPAVVIECFGLKNVRPVRSRLAAAAHWLAYYSRAQ